MDLENSVVKPLWLKHKYMKGVRVAKGGVFSPITPQPIFPLSNVTMARLNLFNRSKSGFKGGVKGGVKSPPRLSPFALSKEAFIHMFVREHANWYVALDENSSQPLAPTPCHLLPTGLLILMSRKGICLHLTEATELLVLSDIVLGG